MMIALMVGIAIEIVTAHMIIAIMRIAIVIETMIVIVSKEMSMIHLFPEEMNGITVIKEMITGMSGETERIGETGMIETIAPTIHMKETANGTSVIVTETMITIPQEEVVS